jgi:hypothetical protein
LAKVNPLQSLATSRKPRVEGLNAGQRVSHRFRIARRLRQPRPQVVKPMTDAPSPVQPLRRRSTLRTAALNSRRRLFPSAANILSWLRQNILRQALP